MRMRCREKRPRSRETSLTRWPVEGNAFLSWFVPVLGCIAKRVGITMISSQFHLQPQQEDCSHWINSLCLLQIVIFIKETTVAWCNQHSTCKTHKKVKRTPLNWTKRDKTCTFSRKSSFSIYVQHKKTEKQTINWLSLRQLDAGRLAEAKGHETDWRDKEYALV